MKFKILVAVWLKFFFKRYYFLNIYTAGSLLRSSSSKDTLSSVSIASLDDRMEKRTEMAKLPLIKCNNSEDKGLCSDVYEIPIDEVESVVQGAHFDSGNDRFFSYYACHVLEIFYMLR